MILHITLLLSKWLKYVFEWQWTYIIKQKHVNWYFDADILTDADSLTFYEALHKHISWSTFEYLQLRSKVINWKSHFNILLISRWIAMYFRSLFYSYGTGRQCISDHCISYIFLTLIYRIFRTSDIMFCMNVEKF